MGGTPCPLPLGRPDTQAIAEDTSPIYASFGSLFAHFFPNTSIHEAKDSYGWVMVLGLS